MSTFTSNWEFWLDENILPVIAKWLMDEIKIKCVSFHILGLNNTSDIEIYNIGRKKVNVVIISKDNDFLDLYHGRELPRS